MRVTQQNIADKVGLSRTTVTKILNRDPKYITSDETRDKVFKAAEDLGYNFTQIRRPYRREYGRAEVNTDASITVVFNNGDVFDKGTAVVRNVSVGGALLANVNLPRGVLPLKKFSIILRIKEIEGLKDLIGECEIVRFKGLDNRDMDIGHIGVKFISISDRDKERIRNYVNEVGVNEGGSPMTPKH